MPHPLFYFIIHSLFIYSLFLNILFTQATRLPYQLLYFALFILFSGFTTCFSKYFNSILFLKTSFFHSIVLFQIFSMKPICFRENYRKNIFNHQSFHISKISLLITTLYLSSYIFHTTKPNLIEVINVLIQCKI